MASSRTLAAMALCLVSMVGSAEGNTVVRIRDCDMQSHSDLKLTINKSVPETGDIVPGELEMTACDARQVTKFPNGVDGYAHFDCAGEISLQLNARSNLAGVAGKSSLGLKNPSGSDPAPVEERYGTCGDTRGNVTEAVVTKFEFPSNHKYYGVEFMMTSIRPIADSVCDPTQDIDRSNLCIFTEDDEIGARIEGVGRLSDGDVIRFDARYYDEDDEVAMCAYVEVCRGNMGTCLPLLAADDGDTK